MRILLIDVDSKIPNIALMKLGTYHKSIGDIVQLISLGISYYPNKKKMQKVDANGYDKVYVSIIFSGNYDFIIIIGTENIEYGGTGYSITKKLPKEIDQIEYDYGLYPENEISYGFLTRGCVRDCYFCLVPQKEGLIHQVNTIDQIVKHKKVKFLDNNILAWKGHKDIFRELIDKKIHCQFNQGLDIRLIGEENAYLLSKIKYLGEYIFAFDDLRLEDIINTKLLILKKHISKDWRMKFFLYCHPDMEIKEDVYYRMLWCKRNKVLPYLMRDISCWDSANNRLYTDLAAWCNQPGIFKKMDFQQFMNRRHPNDMKRVYTEIDILQ